MAILDWVLLLAFLAFITHVAYSSKQYNKSIADFLAANRCAGRYLLCVSQNLAGLGAISAIALFEVFYKAGFVAQWWNFLIIPVVLIVSLSGWVVYRFRETRALTLAQFFEMRYSRRFRIFAGFICFGAGIFNFSLYPAIGTKFFLYFLELPTSVTIAGISLSTFAILMLLLLVISLLFTFWGGQVSVLITDFWQGIFCGIVFVIVMGYLMFTMDWTAIQEAVVARPAGESMVNPLDTGKVHGFNAWYFIILVVGTVYNWQGWQSNQAYNSCGKSAHETKMGKMLIEPRQISLFLMLMFLPICAYTIMNHPQYAATASEINVSLHAIENSYDQFQMITPLVLLRILPQGVIGLFAAFMLAAFIASNDSMLHSWGSIFLQDVVMPLRKKPFRPKEHMFLLRLSITGVAIFAFIFSLVYDQAQHIYMFFAVTGAIYLGGAGIVVIGGLYWRRGTTLAAFLSMTLGATLGIAGFILNQYYVDFPVNGQWFYLIAMVTCTIVYVITSLAGQKELFDLDRLLHRQLAMPANTGQVSQGGRFLRRIGISEEFSTWDKCIYFFVIAYGVILLAVFCTGMVAGLVTNADNLRWFLFWKKYLFIMFCVGVVLTCLFTIGGIRDVRRLCKDLREIVRSAEDDGRVHHGQSPPVEMLAEPVEDQTNIEDYSVSQG